mgnify:CR=1 FL=1
MVGSVISAESGASVGSKPVGSRSVQNDLGVWREGPPHHVDPNADLAVNRPAALASPGTEMP